jgi:hypothetical protein
MKKISDILKTEKKKPGRPKGSTKLNIQRYADNPSLALPKTEHQKLQELKSLLINSAGANVLNKAIEIAMNDEHPSQGAMIKLCMDRMLPVSMFEKEKNNRSAIQINITGIGEVQTVDNIDVTDVEPKNV